MNNIRNIYATQVLDNFLAELEDICLNLHNRVDKNKYHHLFIVLDGKHHKTPGQLTLSMFAAFLFSFSQLTMLDKT